MQRARAANERRSLRAMRYLFATFAALVLLAGCQFGEPVSLFDDNQGLEKAIGALRGRIGGRPYVLNVTIASDAVTIRAQNNADRSRVDEWRLARVHMASFNWERVTGPQAFALRLLNPDLEANLFDLEEVDFAAASAFGRAAVESAALTDKGKLVRMDIARQAYPSPRPASGEVRWTAVVKGEQESALIFADARGVITGADISETKRGKALDILAKPDLTADAVQGIRFLLGRERVLLQVNIAARSIDFETLAPETETEVKTSGNANSRQSYVWNINGLQRGYGGDHADATTGNKRHAFEIDEANWSALPGIAGAAAAKLSMPQGRITSIELAKPENPTGPPILLWKVEVSDQGGKKGYVLFDTAGTAKQVMPQ
jgi:hypothetical protein